MIRRTLLFLLAAFCLTVPSPAADKPVQAGEYFNIPYATLPNTPTHLLSLDIYSNGAPTSTPRPVVVMVHGGGWAMGDKANDSVGAEKAEFFNANGFIYVSINYRLSPQVQHPAHAEDVAAALAWVVDHIATYGGDPSKITLMGHSAGAHLAALVALDERYLSQHSKSSSSLNGVILLDTAGFDIPRNLDQFAREGVARHLYETAFGTDRKTWREASPISHIRDGQKRPRFLVFHIDRASSQTLSRDFVTALQKSGTSASVVLARGKSHRTLNTDIGQADDGPSRVILDFLRGKETFPAEL